MIIVHVLLPVMHLYSILVVRAHVKTDEWMLEQARQASSAPPMIKKAGGGGGLNQCHKCQMAAAANGTMAAGENGNPYRYGVLWHVL